MSEAKDPAIKLFGMTIPVAEVLVGGGCGGGSLEASSSIAIEVEPVEEGEDNNNNNIVIININNNNTSKDMDVDQEQANSVANCSSSSMEDNTDKDGEEEQDGDNDNKEIIGEKPTDTKDEDGAQPVPSEEQKNSDATSGISENAKTPSVEKESATPKASKTEEEQSETSNSQEKTSEASNSQEKTLKKPDKILPCQRCNSMDTKFCYYNNYNVNQPRHFCKNCQRYWTAGGTMRNVPVGAGRRKNKNSASHYRHINVSEALQNSRCDVPTIVHAHHPSLKSNDTVLTFGSDAPLCESMASVLNLADKTMQNCTQNGFHKPKELRIPVPYGGVKNGDNSANGFSVTTSNSKDEAGKSGSQEQVIQNCQSFPPQMPCFPGAPWPYSWNSAQWSPPVPLPAFCPPGFPMPFYPAAAYWGCSVPGAWNIPWIPQPSSPNLGTPSSGPNSPTLGKHSRDENPLKSNSSVEEEPPKESNSERCLWIPKTLRIDDPGEAAKSSIWATLGIKNVQADSITGGGLFKAFQTKDNERNHMAENSKVLQANPAAMSRSLSFQERS